MSAPAAAPTPNYVHRATYVAPTGRRRPDGDTFRLRLDLGTYAGTVLIDPVVTIRLKGIDCYEWSTAKGKEAAAFCAGLLANARSIVVATEKPQGGSLGETLARTVAQVWVDDWDLADLLRAAGFAKPPGQEHLG